MGIVICDRTVIMDTTIRLLVSVVLIGACSAGNGYNYIRPANNFATSQTVTNDGSTKSLYFFNDPDDHRRVSQQRTYSYRQSIPYTRTTTTYSRQVYPPQRQTSYSRVSYSQASTPQQNTITYTQKFPQQHSSVTYTQHRPVARVGCASCNLAPQHPVSFSVKQIAPKQLPFITMKPIQSTITYNQVAPQQQHIVYNQQLPLNSNQIIPNQQQLSYTNNQAIPVGKQNLQVIFVRTPGYEQYTEALLKMAKEAIQSQTIVYVLSKEPDIAELTRRFQEIQATARKMPEVRFIKYKTDDEAVQAQQAIQAQYEGLPGTTNPIGTLIGSASTGKGAETEVETETRFDTEPENGSLNYYNSDDSTSSGGSGTSSSSSSSSSSSISTTNTEDDLYSQSSPPFLPTGVDVVPGSSYLPPPQTAN